MVAPGPLGSTLTRRQGNSIDNLLLVLVILALVLPMPPSPPASPKLYDGVEVSFTYWM